MVQCQPSFKQECLKIECSPAPGSSLVLTRNGLRLVGQHVNISQFVCSHTQIIPHMESNKFHHLIILVTRQTLTESLISEVNLFHLLEALAELMFCSPAITSRVKTEVSLETITHI